MHKSDDLFLARFRGGPCEICGATNGFYGGKTIRSMGHHLLSKELHRLYRYDPDNIIILCPKHHLGGELSPHSHDTAAQAAFFEWLKEHNIWKYTSMMARRHDKFNKEWCYREMYERLGGEIKKEDKGIPLPMKEWKPKNHARHVREAEA